MKGTSFDLDKAKAEYAEFIKTVPENRRLYFQRAFEGANYVKINNPKISFGYNPKSDEMLFNPYHPAFGDFSFIVANTHELAHRIDETMFFDSSKNTIFTEAINNARNILDANSDKFLALANTDEMGFMSDVFSAIADNDYDFTKGHPKWYWQIPGRKAAEVLLIF